MVIYIIHSYRVHWKGENESALKITFYSFLKDHKFIKYKLILYLFYSKLLISTISNLYALF